jgi:UDP-3-O-[3-hydroxymyristoyl] glucosamine N-acyltransferase
MDGALYRVGHGGGVRLARGVEIQSNTCVDRALFGGFTEIGEDCLIDNLVHVAHNVRMGPRCRVAACAMVGGSVVLGEEVWIGPNASISSEITVGGRAFVTLGAVVTRDVGNGEHVSGNFAIDHTRFLAFLRTVR